MYSHFNVINCTFCLQTELFTANNSSKFRLVHRKRYVLFTLVIKISKWLKLADDMPMIVHRVTKMKIVRNVEEVFLVKHWSNENIKSYDDFKTLLLLLFLEELEL